MADMVQADKKIALLHRYPEDRIAETNAAFPYLAKKGIDVLTFKSFDRLGKWGKFFKSIAWIFYAPMLIYGKDYDVIYIDDSYPFVPITVKLCTKAKVVIRLGVLHLMYYTSGWLYSFLHFFENMGWQMADEIICISVDMALYVSRDARKRVHVAYDPVDREVFKPEDSQKRGIVMFHGVLTKNKNIDLMLAAAVLLPKILFVIIGDGPDRRRLENLATDNVIFRGWVPFHSIPHCLADCDVGLALRSDNPGNEYVVTSPFIQYAAMGKPCLVNKRRIFGGYPWQFSSVEEMVDKIKILLERPEEGEKLRKEVLKNHDAKKVAKKIWSLLSS